MSPSFSSPFLLRGTVSLVLLLGCPHSFRVASSANSGVQTRLPTPSMYPHLPRSQAGLANLQALCLSTPLPWKDPS